MNKDPNIFSKEVLDFLNSCAGLKFSVLEILTSILSNPEISPRKKFYLNGGTVIVGSIESYKKNVFTIVDSLGNNSNIYLIDLKKIEDASAVFLENSNIVPFSKIKEL